MTIKDYLENLQPQQMLIVYTTEGALLADNTVEILSKSTNPRWFSLKVVSEIILKDRATLTVEL